MRSADILATASSLTGGPRALLHGDKRRTHEAIAALWNAYLDSRAAGPGAPLTALDVMHLMVLLKLARTLTGLVHNPDNWIDMAGYAALAGELAEPVPAPQPAGGRTP